VCNVEKGCVKERKIHQEYLCVWMYVCACVCVLCTKTRAGKKCVCSTSVNQSNCPWQSLSKPKLWEKSSDSNNNFWLFRFFHKNHITLYDFYPLHLGGNLQKFLSKFVRFFITLGLKIFILLRLKVVFEADIIKRWC